MEGDTPQIPITQEVQPEVKDISQTPQQPFADPQTLPKPTPPAKLKKWLIVGIIGIIIIILGAIGYFYFSGEKESVVDGEGWFQAGNTQPITQFQTRPSIELEDNRIGESNTGSLREFSEEFLDFVVDQMSNQGLKWDRLSLDDFDWSNLVNGEGKYSRYYIDPLHNEMVTNLANNGIKIMYVLEFLDEEIQIREGYSRFKIESETQRYLDYIQFIVHNFKDRIEYYEILNEPNDPVPVKHVELADYINLVKRTVPVIRQEYPEAKIVVGAVAECEHDYLFGLLESDVMPLVDSISWHAGPRYGLGYDEISEYYYEYPSIVQEIKDVASAHGFTGEYIVEELIWWTSGDSALSPDFPWIYTEMLSAKYYARAVMMHLGMNVTVGVDRVGVGEHPITGRVIQNLSTLMAGANAIDLPIEIQSDATDIKSYSFSLTNGDNLIALWTDGVAVNDDPGVNTTLTIPNLLAQKVMAIDVLEGYQQDVVTTTEGGNLTIQNLKVRDYPVILRVSESNK